MPYLEVLNIRNLPEIYEETAKFMDYFVKGLAETFVAIVNKERKSTLLKTVALGAPLYMDLKIDPHIVDSNVSNILRFRVYNVDYDYPSPSAPVLSQIVKGAECNTDDGFSQPGLLYDYWLG